jgi:hypothetical protein
MCSVRAFEAASLRSQTVDVDRLLQEITFAAELGLFYLALFGALALPDICGGMESPNGQANEKKYIDWFDKWVAPKYDGMVSGQDCYGFRCSMLHQARARPHKGSFSRVIFLEPNTRGIFMHRNILNDALNLDIGTFCGDVVAGARGWLPTVEASADFQANLSAFMTRHPNGIAPYIVGMPVIG